METWYYYYYSLKENSIGRDNFDDIQGGRRIHGGGVWYGQQVDKTLGRTRGQACVWTVIGMGASRLKTVSQLQCWGICQGDAMSKGGVMISRSRSRIEKNSNPFREGIKVNEIKIKKNNLFFSPQSTASYYYLWRETCFPATWRIVLPSRKSWSTTRSTRNIRSNNFPSSLPDSMISLLRI